MNRDTDIEVSEAAGNQVAEGTGGCRTAQGSSVEGTTKALAGGILHSHRKH